MNPQTATQIAAILAATLIAIAIILILSHKTDTDIARTAIKHKLQELFTEPTEEAMYFRTHILYRSNRPDLLKQQLIEEANHWTPDTTQQAPEGYAYPNSTILTGRLYKLHTEVTILNGKAAHTLIEVD